MAGSFTALLNDLVELLIEQGDYEICNMQGAGHRLEGLQLHNVHNVIYYFILLYSYGQTGGYNTDSNLNNHVPETAALLATCC